MTEPSYPCPLCYGVNNREIYRDRQGQALTTGGDAPSRPAFIPRAYHRCARCNLIFVLPHALLSAQAEKAEYDQHQNHPQDLGYRRFLSRLANPLLDVLAPQSQGLDFGSGPGPTLSVMLAAAGHTIALYDPFYADDAGVFDQP
jgi:hypothetical protein